MYKETEDIRLAVEFTNRYYEEFEPQSIDETVSVLKTFYNALSSIKAPSENSKYSKNSN